jgi:hypothetical protein
VNMQRIPEESISHPLLIIQDWIDDAKIFLVST